MGCTGSKNNTKAVAEAPAGKTLLEKRGAAEAADNKEQPQAPVEVTAEQAPVEVTAEQQQVAEVAAADADAAAAAGDDVVAANTVAADADTAAADTTKVFTQCQELFIAAAADNMTSGEPAATATADDAKDAKDLEDVERPPTITKEGDEVQKPSKSAEAASPASQQGEVGENEVENQVAQKRWSLDLFSFCSACQCINGDEVKVDIN